MMSTSLCGRRTIFSSHVPAMPATSFIFTTVARDFRTPKNATPASYLSFSTDTRPYTQLRPIRSLSQRSILSPRSYSSSSASHGALSKSINPPETTNPAILDLPTPKEAPKDISTKFQHYISVGRAYLSFYKTGVKNVYFNYRSSLPLRKSLDLPLYIPISPPSSAISGSGKDKEKNRNKALSSLSRSDFQLLRRSAYDVRRMIPFAFILLICGEFTPLVVLALGNAICPRTCRVPRQLEKERVKRVERLNVVVGAGLVGGKEKGKKEGGELGMLMGYADPRKLKGMKGKDLDAAAALFDLSSRVLPSGGLLDGVYKRRLRRWVEYLVVDDGLIVKGGGVERMSAEEVKIAVEERGGVGVGLGLSPAKEAAAEREWLKRWISGRVKDGVI